MFKKLLFVSLIIVGLIAGPVMASDFTAKYDRPAECFMSLDYMDYQGPAPTVWFVDKVTSSYGRNYIRAEGDIWRNRHGYKDEVVKVFNNKTVVDAWLCPEIVMVVATPPPAVFEVKSFVVHFDFDEDIIKSEEMPIVEEAAAYAAEWPGSDVLLDAFCDFRGSDAYNVGLGERRAAAVEHTLIENGVSAGRLDVVNNGDRMSPMRIMKGIFCVDCWEDRRVKITIE